MVKSARKKIGIDSANNAKENKNILRSNSKVKQTPENDTHKSTSGKSVESKKKLKSKSKMVTKSKNKGKK